LYPATGALDDNQEKIVAEALRSLKEAERIISDFISKDWADYRRNLAGKQFDYEAVIR
jgi:hypothetical protein